MKQQTQDVDQLEKEEVLLLLLKKEIGYYEAVLDLTTQENEIFLFGLSVKNIPKLLKEKNILLSCIEEIEEVLQPIKKNWSLESKQEKANLRLTKDIKEQFTILKKVMKKILDLDLKNQENMKTFLLSLKKTRSNVGS